MSEWRWFVPGRLEVFGKHTDYAGGRSLVAAVPRGITLAAWPADDGQVTVNHVSFPVVGCRPADGWHRYAAAVVARLSRNFPGAPLSARIEFSSTLPAAAGMSSSSALVIAIAEALIARARIEETTEWRRAIRSVEDRVTYFACIENGAPFGPLDGDGGVGTRGGSEDHAAIVTSRGGYLQQVSFSPLRFDRAVRMPPGWTFAVASTGVAARKTGEALEDYNRAAALAEEIVAAWRRQHPDDRRTLGELVRDGVAGDLDLPPALRARLDHFIAEDARVPAAADALEAGDVAPLGPLAERSQADAGRLLRNQLPETEHLVEAALAEGAAAACGFGAGWGGSVWALIPTPACEAFLEGWLGRYGARHPHLAPEGFASPPGSGAIRL